MTDPYTELQRLRDRLAELEAMAERPTDFNVELRQAARRDRRVVVDAPKPAPADPSGMNAILRRRPANTPTEPEGDPDD